ncbi:MAG: stage II sporulation protein P [Ruminococcaceae bacterium]|nr:stage II sporulation protein P [Oscillospiraceae bacterium]
MKKTDKLLIALLLCAAVFCVVKFVPNKQQVALKMFENLIKIHVREGQSDLVQEYLSVFRLLHHEMGNPLKSPQPEKESAVQDLSQTDPDVAALQQQARKKAGTTKAAGKVVERTIENMTQQVSSGNVKVQNRTDKSIDIDKILKEGAKLKISDKSKPSILVYHTHTHECFVQLDSGTYMKGETTQSADSAQNVVRVGNAIVEQLERAGFSVIHDTAIHDDDYNNAYANSGKTIDGYLKKYPSIDVTIDIHRDSVGVEGDSDARTSLVKKIAGKKAAQVMIVTGCEENAIEDFPDWYDNLHFALGLQKQFSEDFPGLARPLYFADRRYNMYKTKNSVLIEVGSDGNTLEQAVYSGKLVGATLANYLAPYAQSNS